MKAQENLVKSLVQIQWHRKKAGPHCLCAARWNNVTTVRVTMTNHLCLMHPHTTTMYNYMLYTKARYLESKSILGMKIPCAISREKWYYQLAHQVCKQDRQDNGNCKHIKPKNIDTGGHKLFLKNMSIIETVSSVHKNHCCQKFS